MVNPAKTLSRGLHSIGMWTMKNSPELLLSGGILTSLGGAVMAANVTPHAEGEMNRANARREVSRQAYANGTITELELKRDATQIKAEELVAIAKVYAPVMAIESASIGMLIWSHCILRKRLQAMALAYTAISTAFAQYRDRIQKEYGMDADQYALTGIKPKTLAAGTIVDGKKIEEAMTENLLPNEISPYARYFDANSKMWKGDYDMNMSVLALTERWANQQLHMRGYLFLNEVYNHLGFPPSPEGQVVGWWDDMSTGDAQVKLRVRFGVRAIADGLGGYEHAMIIDPNVDGPIFERLRTVNPVLTAAITPADNREIGLIAPESEDEENG